MACVAEASSTVTSGRTGAGSSAAGADSASAAYSAGVRLGRSLNLGGRNLSGLDLGNLLLGSSQPLGPWPSSPRQIRQAYHRTRTRRQANARCPWRRPRTQPPHGARRPWHAPRAWDWADPFGWTCGYGSCCRRLPYVATFLCRCRYRLFPIHDTPPRTKKTAPKDRLSHRFTVSRQEASQCRASRDDRGCSECAGTR